MRRQLEKRCDERTNRDQTGSAQANDLYRNNSKRRRGVERVQLGYVVYFAHHSKEPNLCLLKFTCMPLVYRDFA